MNIKKIILSAILFCLLPYLQSCSSDAEAETNSNTENSIMYESDFGIQDDILYQQTTVIDNDETYNNFILTIVSSMSSDAPIYDFNEKTVITVITDIRGCSFYPRLDAVIDTGKTIKVKITNVLSTGVCDISPRAGHRYFLISISKTSKPISVIIENE